MQTKLRMAVIIFAASLLGVSLTSAASHPAQSQTKSLTRVKQAENVFNRNGILVRRAPPRPKDGQWTTI